jgi:hypothetical protein
MPAETQTQGLPAASASALSFASSATDAVVRRIVVATIGPE